MVEQVRAPVGGKWNFDEKTLQWIFEARGTAVFVDKQDKKKRAKADNRAKKGDRAASSLTNKQGRGGGTGGSATGNRHGSARPSFRLNKHTTVLLDDIKALSYDMLARVEQVSPEFERGIYNTESFDYFLYNLLYYFDCVFKKEKELSKGRATTSIEPSEADRNAYAEACAKVELGQKRLGRAYCQIVLGLDPEVFHHMNCGQSRVSATHSDRNLFETFYAFCCFVVWITFKGRDFDIIKRELGRMLRSQTFNPAIRVRNAPETDEVEKTDPKNPKKKITPAEHRRLHPKRPAIKSIIHQRSPAVVAILPSPKEEARHLFTRERPPSPSSLQAYAKNIMDDDGTLAEINAAMNDIDLLIQKKSFKVGILGDLLEKYDPQTLMPIEAEDDGAQKEDEDRPDENSRGIAETAAGQQHQQLDGATAATAMAGAAAAGAAMQAPRQPTATTRATTEGSADEAEDDNGNNEDTEEDE